MKSLFFAVSYLTPSVSESSLQVGSDDGRFGDAQGADACCCLGRCEMTSVAMSSAPVMEICDSCKLFCRPSQSMDLVGRWLGSLSVSMPLISFCVLSFVVTSAHLLYPKTKNFQSLGRCVI